MVFEFDLVSARILFVMLCFLLYSRKATAQIFPDEECPPTSVSTILIFGDSTVDPGNNNYVSTIFKSDFPPYGKDFVNHKATGRFTNGRLATDIFAKYIGIKEYVPAYLDPKLTINELKTGVSFASAASGYDPLTPKMSSVIPFSEQLQHFKEYCAKLEMGIGKNKTKKIIKNALFFISAGTNDFVVNYFRGHVRRNQYTLPEYQRFVLQQARKVYEGLLGEGAKRIGVAGLPPMGCLPIVITMYSDDPTTKRDCIGNFSSVARDYNGMLINELNDIQQQPRSLGLRIAYIDIYKPLEDMTLGHKYGFKEVNKGCCGTGTLEMSILCNPLTPTCEDANKYVFWDSIHPTEKSYNILFQANRQVIDWLVKK